MPAIPLDVRHLPPPEPMERILDTLADMPPGSWLRVLLPRDPQPLYGILKNLGFRWSTRILEPGTVEVLIWPSADPSPSERS